jgi:hypothetical protein
MTAIVMVKYPITGSGDLESPAVRWCECQPVGQYAHHDIIKEEVLCGGTVLSADFRCQTCGKVEIYRYNLVEAGEPDDGEE